MAAWTSQAPARSPASVGPPAHRHAEGGELLAHDRRDDVDVRPAVDEPAGAPGRHRAAADDDHEAAGDVQRERIGHSHGNGPAIPAATVAPDPSSTRMNAPVRRLTA